MSTAVAPRQHDQVIADLERKGLVFDIRDSRTGKVTKGIKWAGVLTLSHDRGLFATESEIIQVPGPDNGQLAVVKSVAYFERDGKAMRFTGIGTCGPANANKMTGGYPVEMAQTRSLVRACKQGINAGDLTFVDELPEYEEVQDPRQQQRQLPAAQSQQKPTPATQPQHPAPAQPAPQMQPRDAETVYTRLVAAQQRIYDEHGIVVYLAPAMDAPAAEKRLAGLTEDYKRLREAAATETPAMMSAEQRRRIEGLHAKLGYTDPIREGITEQAAALWLTNLVREFDDSPRGAARAAAR